MIINKLLPFTDLDIVLLAVSSTVAIVGLTLVTVAIVAIPVTLVRVKKRRRAMGGTAVSKPKDEYDYAISSLQRNTPETQKTRVKHTALVGDAHLSASTENCFGGEDVYASYAKISEGGVVINMGNNVAYPSSNNVQLTLNPAYKPRILAATAIKTNVAYLPSNNVQLTLNTAYKPHVRTATPIETDVADLPSNNVQLTLNTAYKPHVHTATTIETEANIAYYS